MSPVFRILTSGTETSPGLFVSVFFSTSLSLFLSISPILSNSAPSLFFPGHDKGLVCEDCL